MSSECNSGQLKIPTCGCKDARTTRSVSICLQFILDLTCVCVIALPSQWAGNGPKICIGLRTLPKVLHFNSLLTADHLHWVLFTFSAGARSQEPGPRTKKQGASSRCGFPLPHRFACVGDAIFNLANFGSSCRQLKAIPRAKLLSLKLKIPGLGQQLG